MAKERLLQKIRNAIQKEGAISFARYMEFALYDPEEGYYATEANIGFRGGDYYTSPHLHPLFGRLIAKQLIEMVHSRGGGPFMLVEMGGGKGLLAHDVLFFLEKNEPLLFDRIRYVLLERSDRMREVQEARLLPWKGKVSWAGDLAEVPFEGVGCFFSNELFDAFPVHRLLLTGERIEEIYVTCSKDGFQEVLGPPSSEALRLKVAGLGFRPKEPTQIEVNLLAPQWIETIAGRLARGFILTIDYGHLAHDLYSERRPRGTLLCYHRHRVNEEPYQRVGEQDMTAHVNFTDLIQAGERSGLKTVGFTDQLNFLLGLGIVQEMEKIAARSQTSDQDPEFLALKQLIHPQGMGKIFKVLIQSKGEVRQDLSGLAFKPFFADLDP
jgi:SAM-dependent MidA family methyltransferase